jgi:hypothetical protein
MPPSIRVEQRAFDALADGLGLFGILGQYQQHVGSGPPICLRASKSTVDAFGRVPAGVGASDDHEVRVPPGLHGSLDLVHHVL